MIVEISGAAGRSTRERVLAFIRLYQALEGVPPSYREIAEGLGLALGSITTALDALERQRLVARECDRPRTLRAVGEPLVVRALPVAYTIVPSGNGEETRV